MLFLVHCIQGREQFAAKAFLYQQQTKLSMFYFYNAWPKIGVTKNTAIWLEQQIPAALHKRV